MYCIRLIIYILQSKKLLTINNYWRNLHKNYKKTDRAAININNIIKADIHTAKKLDLADRINTAAERESFITLEDHKANFKNKPTCQLINPSEPEIGKISKQLLEKKINSKGSKG